jgi:hypothetical protein
VRDAAGSCQLWELLRMLRVDVVRWEEIVVEEKRTASLPDQLAVRSPPPLRQRHQRQEQG